MSEKETDAVLADDEPTVVSRHNERTPVSCAARVVGPRGPEAAHVISRDVSTGGMFISGTTEDVGSRVSIEIDLPSGETKKVDGEVRWTRPERVNSTMPAGIGVAFDEPQPDLHDAIRASVRRQEDTDA